ncbi:hypothetical protein Q4E93_14000 [Flavitalea sp. BT771]|uniref:glycine-rich domain-containing protein n=1 Tax=Flavitalea sp. BT771 TaxID=3063329 RepID=UPI0026E1E4CA|nr:hypothetical protein [Flavitalea sp. BT771]MDO6431712.1 hypothetical protein [Flavitalea sp. BT771]MDV6220620.1 hypothetical protein [Flavitalea sp. BT771]
MVPQEHLPLWDKIQSFPIDDGTAVVPFSAKLAATQKWSIEFTHRAIEEYRKFILLCCISEKGASPSRTVDEVWHLHLTYTQSYWKDLCRDTLGKDIHHHPSSGGDQEDHKHQEWYKETLAQYRSLFDVDPPSDVWPPPEPGVSIPEEPRVTWNRSAVASVVILLLSPFLFIDGVYHTLSPFTLGGPHFLVFFPLYGAALFFSYVIYRWQVKRSIDGVVADYFPTDVSTFQMADLLYGRHRALQASIIDLTRRELIEVTKDNFFQVKKAKYRTFPKEENPLITAYAEAEDGSIHAYDELYDKWYTRGKFSHPALEALNKFGRRPESFARAYLFHFAFYMMLLVRCIQAMMNDRPFVLLLLEAAVLSVLFFVALRSFSKSSLVRARVKERLERLVSKDAELVSKFALEGIPAINGLTEGVLLTGIFASYTPVSSWGSSNGGSSCSGGSSCGGGSCGGGGGGGCGGCGGGD